jgi:hypothetical protein
MTSILSLVRRSTVPIIWKARTPPGPARSAGDGGPDWDRIQGELPIQQQTLDRFNELSGATIQSQPVMVSGGTALSSVANRLSMELTSTEDPKVWMKLGWLFDRVVRALGGQAKADMLPKTPGLIAALAVASAKFEGIPPQA